MCQQIEEDGLRVGLLLRTRPERVGGGILHDMENAGVALTARHLTAYLGQCEDSDSFDVHVSWLLLRLKLA